MKPIFLALSGLFAVTSLTATAEAPVVPSDFKSSVMAKAAESQKGVIVVISERGDVAVDAAYLLSAQLKQNPGFVPLLLVPEQEKLEGYMRTLALPRESLPAVIFFNKSGKELGRVIGAQPTAVSLLGFKL
jgi:hypothetical protein